MNSGSSWFYDLNGTHTGPVSIQVIRSLARQGIISHSTLVSEGSTDTWVPFSSVEDRIVAKPAVAQAAPAAAPAAVPTVPQANASSGSVNPQFPPQTSQYTAPGGYAGSSVPRHEVSGFGEAISVCFQKYFTFSGRANRSEFWYFNLFGFLVLIGLSLLVGLSMGAMQGSPVVGVLPLLLLAVQLGLYIPLLSVSIRRLHDTDKSGWWYLIMLIPFIGAIALIIFFAQRGTLQTNRFG